MTSANSLIVIARSDISPWSQVSSGSTQYAGYPQNTAEAQCDCACPDDGMVLKSMPSSDDSSALYTLPELHTGAVNDQFTLGFNPLGSAGVTVFNRPVFDLLRSFQHSRTLDDGARLLGAAHEGPATLRRLVELGLLEPVGTQRKPARSQPQTLTAWLHVTNNCNLRCPYCYVHKTPDPMQLHKGRQAVDAVFRSALNNGFRRVKLKYAGGEATLNFPTALAMHEHAQRLAATHNLALEGVVLSNGVALSDRMIEAMKTHDLRLMISLDGVGEYHDRQRPFVNGRGSFVHVERTLDRLAVHDFIPSISITVSNQNLAGLPETVEYVLRRGLPFTLNFYRENDCSAPFSELAYQEESIIDAMKAAFAVIEASLPPHNLLDRLVDLSRLDVLHDRTCGVGHSYMAINQQGVVAKCHMEIEQAITDIGAPDPLQLLQKDEIGLQNLSVEDKEGCRDCTWRYWCAGGCPALTYRTTGRFDVKSPNCRIYKALYPEVLRLEGLRLLKYSGTLAM